MRQEMILDGCVIDNRTDRVYKVLFHRGKYYGVGFLRKENDEQYGAIFVFDERMCLRSIKTFNTFINCTSITDIDVCDDHFIICGCKPSNIGGDYTAFVARLTDKLVYIESREYCNGTYNHFSSIEIKDVDCMLQGNRYCGKFITCSGEAYSNQVVCKISATYTEQLTLISRSRNPIYGEGYE